jgi:peroxiredoxin
MVAVNSTMLPLGAPAPDFSLPDPSGKPWSFDDVAGERGTLVAFVCNHCPYVKHIANTFGALTAKWQESGVGVVAVNSNDVDRHPEDAPEKMADYAAHWHWSFPYVVDADQSVAKSYQAACTPDFFLFDSDRRLVYRGRFDGSTPGNNEPITGAELDAAVTALASGDAIAGDQVPSIGCNIKWKPGGEPEWFG